MFSKVVSPLVSCIMPTHNRRTFVPQAIRYFLLQDYPHKELIIVDDGTDCIGDLLPTDKRIRYIRLPVKATIGSKRNRACQEAQGLIIVHWDDDDWHAPYQLSYQAEAILRAGADICGVGTVLFYDIKNHTAWRYTHPEGQRLWVAGNALCYTRAFWEGNRFADIHVGEDNRFIMRARAERITVLPNATFHVGIIHEDNVSPKHPNTSSWQPCPREDIRQLMGEDWIFYHPELAETHISPAHIKDALTTSERRIEMLTVAMKGDLALPEYVAFNHGQTLPIMRRWEIPFALSQSRLGNTMSVLDCTVNPVNFQERLSRLYPHILYRHWNPIQNGQFVLPMGVPDEAFDRVICINTLEHLLRPQREALMAAMARKLKPGGLLTLTSDYYFDSSWSNPLFLRSGVMQLDGQEIFNGWNKIRLPAWLELCRQYNLLPLAEPAQFREPCEHDPLLYLHPEYDHACIGGVFSKSPQTQLPAGKKIVLALLTWNTCAISVESIHAYIREARMLQRLGQQPYLCVCDNGSTDGTADALRTLDPQIDIPHKFIFNPENLGNSIARNQIIDYMLECDADYLLFMDGDIEIVPFSSFAMLRYMENNGHRLGCIGADSNGQTPIRQRASTSIYSIEGCRLETTNLVAWTQYGMFRRDLFDDGIRFDETAPFDGPGWGFEDNDLAFQMDTRGYLNQRFFGMIYLHRNARSSIRIMSERGIDAKKLYVKRKQYVIDKWTSIPHINNGPLMDVRRAYVAI